MNKFLILALLIVFFIARAFVLTLNRKNPKYVWISFFVTTIPFQFVKAVGEENPDLVAGTLGSTFYITVPILLILIFWLLSVLNRRRLSIRFDKWVYVVFLLIIISLCNPWNVLFKGTMVFVFFFLSHILLFTFFSQIFSRKEILDGLFEGFVVLCFLQFVLALCFPLLGIKAVTSLFHASAEGWSTRMDTRNGAVGVFVSPGNLALFSIMSANFFFATFLYGFKKKMSFLFLIFITITIVLTYSRTAYLAFIVVLLSEWFIVKNAHKNIFSPFNLIKVALPIAVLLVWLIYFSPFSEVFLKSDADNQFDNRMIHWLMALDIFNRSPLIGVGYNAHLAFVAKHVSIATTLTINDFFTANPIHNIHLIILAETGLVGFVAWIIFIVKNIAVSKTQISLNQNVVLSSTLIGVIMTYCFYGLTGWAPFSAGVLPFFLFIVFFAIKFRNGDINADLY